MRDALEVFDMRAFHWISFDGRTPMFRKYLKTNDAYWGIIFFTFYSDILKRLYYLYRFRDHRDQSVDYNENGTCYKGGFLMKTCNTPLKVH